MRIGIKRFFPLLLVALLLDLTGCGQENPSVREVDFDIPDRVVLRVVVDPPYDWFLDHVESISEKFTAVYENVTIEVEELPETNMKQVRTNAVREMQEDLASGEGPDIFFLMSTASNEEELFPDMNFAMRKGYFADLNECYTSDDDLNREELVDEVMEAGVVNGARYLLPLSYEYSIVYADMNRLYEAGLDSSIFDSGVISLLDAVCRLGDMDMADSLRGIELAVRLLQYFPNALDYDTGEVLLTAEELIPFLELMQQYKALYSGQWHDAGILRYYEGSDWWQAGYCMNWGILTDVTEQAAIAKAIGFDLQMYVGQGR